MDEVQVVYKARELVKKAKPTSVPVPVEIYAREVGAIIKADEMEPDEAGCCFEAGGKRFICTNANDTPQRQRFTVCHEVAHLWLRLPSQHGGSAWSYAKRPRAEIFCDIFAAELLLPYDLFCPEAEKAQISLSSIDALAERFDASSIATASRFAYVVTAPVAFVLSENGKVRHASRAKALREAQAWIAPGLELPQGSLTSRVRDGKTGQTREEVDADLWFSDWERGGTLLEEARHLQKWDQTLTLLWFDDEELPARKTRDERGSIIDEKESEDNTLLKELDGQLRWPSKNRR